MKRLPYLLLTGGLAFSLCGNAYGGTVTYDPITTVDISGISTYNTTGNSMKGMQITVNFSSKAPAETVSWNASGLSTGAQGTGWSLSLNNYSYSTYPGAANHAEWTLSTSVSIDSIIINALPGNTFFDITYDPEVTPNSAYGWAISDSDVYPNAGVIANFNAIYSNLIHVPSYTSIDPYPLLWADLYGTLTLKGLTDTANTSPLLASGEALSFFLDTDNTSDIPNVPEPISFLLFGTGLIGLGGYRLKKKTSI